MVISARRFFLTIPTIVILVFFLSGCTFPWDKPAIQKAETLFNEGQQLESDKQYSEALKKYVASTEAYNNYLPSYIQIAKVYKLKNRHDEALKVLQDASKVPDSKAAVNYEMADIYYKKADYENAFKYIGVALSASGTSESNLLMAKILLHKAQKEKIGEYLNKISENSKEYEEASMIKALFERDLGLLKQYSAAIKSDDHKVFKQDLSFFMTQLEKYSSNSKMQVYLTTLQAYMAVKSGYSEVAIPLLEDVTKQNPEYFDAFLYLGIAHNLVGQTDKAGSVLQTALSLNSSNYLVFAELGRLGYVKNDTNSFTKNFDTAISLAAKEQAQLLREEYIDRLVRKGLYSSATKVFEDLIANKVKDDIATELKYRNQIAYFLLVKAKEYDKVISILKDFTSTESFRQLRGSDIQKAKALSILAGAKIEKSDRVEAEELLKTSLNLDKYSSEGNFYKGLLNYELNKKAEAKEFFVKAIDLDIVGDLGAQAEKLLKDIT